MYFGMFGICWLILSTLSLCLFHSGIQANVMCNQVSSKYYISSKDFIVSRYDPKYVMCAAYFCSPVPTVIPLMLMVNYINYTADNIIVHLEKKSITFMNKCGNCEDDPAIVSYSRKRRANKCLSCPKIEPSKGIEVHVRLDNPESIGPESKICDWNINFNMSIEEFSCGEGKFSLNMPIDSNCNVAFTTSTQLLCFRPTSFQDIIFMNSSDKFIHKFTASVEPQMYIWKLDTKFHKNFKLSFSPSLKSYLYIFKNDLLSPTLELGTCSNIKSEMTIETISSYIYIVYNNNHTLENDALLEISFKVCNFPEFLENGKVEFQHLDNRTTAIFTCNEDFQLMGESHMFCHSSKEPPVCANKYRIKKQDRPMSDDPIFTNKLNNKSIQEDNWNSTLNDPNFQKNIYRDPGDRKEYKLAPDEPELSNSNTSIIELDKVGDDVSKVSQDNESTPGVSSEGSGQFAPEYDDNFTETSDVSDPDTENPDAENPDQSFENATLNTTHSRNKTFIHPWQSDGKLVLFSLPNLQDNMLLFIIIGVGVLLIVIITVISVIVCKNRSTRSGLNRKFDTFQNPIYEKPVVRVPITNSCESDPSQEKLDLGDLSDSTILD